MAKLANCLFRRPRSLELFPVGCGAARLAVAVACFILPRDEALIC